MKKVVLLITTVLLTACASAQNISATVLPTMSQITAIVTATPNIVTATPTQEPTVTTTPIPTITPTPNGTYIVQSGETLGKIAAKFGMPYGYLAEENNIPDPNLIYTGQVLTIPIWPPIPKTDNGKLIIVILSQQEVYVYQDGTLLKTFIVSTGVPQYPTVTGRYKIYVKYKSATMSGDGYYLPDVPWVMYFYQGYGLHGTYWHHNFGHPMSHGCVNMYTPDAEWLFNWADVGTPVWIYL
ncbi:MAG: L,D-transpeptidase family protein [Candidatus Microgenomates bacterium]|jgi:lipoprotein-anchoring transpeptidase ErfK/SrfK